MKFFGFCQKSYLFRYAFFLQYESANGLFTFSKNMIGKHLVDLWSKNLNTNENRRFFKVQYLTNELMYEVELLNVTTAPRKLQILVGYFKWLWSDMPGHVQSDDK